MKKIFLIIIIFFIACGCSKHTIKYSISKSDVNLNKGCGLTIMPFKDERPEEERAGGKGKFLKFASKDSHFKKPIAEELNEILKKEFLKAGIESLNYDNTASNNRYTLSGSIVHYQAALQLPKTTVVPYLKQVASIWSKDKFVIAIEIKITLLDNFTNKKLIDDKSYFFSEDKKLPVGLLSSARYARGFNYKLKLLDKALSGVVEDIRDEVLTEIKNSQ